MSHQNPADGRDLIRAAPGTAVAAAIPGPAERHDVRKASPGTAAAEAAPDPEKRRNRVPDSERDRLHIMAD